MQIKVCGLRQNEDIVSVASSGADYIGLIFYPGSSRYALGIADTGLMEQVAQSHPNVKRVGVFVDADEEEVQVTAEKYSLNVLQFHGEEDPDYCKQFMSDYTVIKAIPIESESDFEICEVYEESCHRFLFDTAGPLRGGNGYNWDWSFLPYYEGNLPFLISGGINPSDVQKVIAIRHPMFMGIDINSGFEKNPGVKDTEAIKSFIQLIKANNYGIQGQ